MGDLYALLEAPSDASPEELRRYYEKAVAKASRVGALRQLAEISAAYDVLSHPGRRSTYDRQGIAVRPERVPGLSDVAVPFRGGAPGLGQQPLAAGASGWARARAARVRSTALQSHGDPVAAVREGLRAARLEKGAYGEQLVAEALSPLASGGWVLLNDVRKPGSPANLDHVLIGPPGVVVLDAKNWSGGRLRLDARGMAVAAHRRDDELISARQDADTVRSLLRRVAPDARVLAAIGLVHEMGLGGPREHHGVTIVERGHLVPWLEALPVTLDDDRVAQLSGLLAEWLPPRVPGPPPTRTVLPRPVVKPARRPGPPESSQRRAPGRRRKSQAPWRGARLRPVAAIGLAVTLLVGGRLIVAALSALVQPLGASHAAPLPAAPATPSAPRPHPRAQPSHCRPAKEQGRPSSPSAVRCLPIPPAHVRR